MITVVSVKSHGDLNNERAVFKVQRSGDIGNQLVLCAKAIKKKDGKRSLQNIVYATYWFIDKDVDEGDLVVLYTKDPGLNYKVKQNDDGSRTHFFYWRKEESIWDQSDVALVSGSIQGWSTYHIVHSGVDVEPD